MDTTPVQHEGTAHGALTRLLDARSKDALDHLHDARPEHVPALIGYLRDARSTRVSRVARAIFLRGRGDTGATLLAMLRPGDDAILDAAIAYLSKLDSATLHSLCAALGCLRHPDAESIALTIVSQHARKPDDDLAALDLLQEVGTRRALVTLAGMRDAAPRDGHGVHARLDAVVQALTRRVGGGGRPGALTAAAHAASGHITLATHTGDELTLAEHASSTHRAAVGDGPSDLSWLDAAPPAHSTPSTSWRARALLLLTQAFAPRGPRVVATRIAHLAMPLLIIVLALVLPAGPLDMSIVVMSAAYGGAYLLTLGWWASWWAIASWRARPRRLMARLKRGVLVNALVDQGHTPRLLRGRGRDRPMTRIRYLRHGRVQERWLDCWYSTANTERVRAWLDGDSIVVFGVHTPLILSDAGRWTVDAQTRRLLLTIVAVSSLGLVSMWWLLAR